MSEKLISAGALFKSSKTNRYLFLLRSSASSYPSKWSLCGGKIHKDEQIMEGLMREITEEMGEIPQIMKWINFNWFKSLDKKFEYHSFLLLVEDEFIPILNGENDGYAWVDLDNPPRPLHPRLREVLTSTLLIDSIKKFK